MIVALGGDGQMLQTMHRYMNNRIPIYGMNRGSVGFDGLGAGLESGHYKGCGARSLQAYRSHRGEW